MKIFRNIFAILGIIGLIGGSIEYKWHAIIIGLLMIFGALAINIKEDKRWSSTQK